MASKTWSTVIFAKRRASGLLRRSCFFVLAGGLACAQSNDVRALLSKLPQLPLVRTELAVSAPLGFVSSTAVDRSGLIYLLQRGEQSDPVIVVSKDGNVVRSW